MGNIIECRAQIPFSSIRKLLPSGVKETVQNLIRSVILSDLTGCGHGEKRASHGTKRDIHCVSFVVAVVVGQLGFD